jgi:uncharacterized membrane protein YvlD (DUF360 family)
MLLHLILPVLLLLAVLLYVVPAVTDGAVAIRRNSAIRGFLALIVIALTNNIFWHVLTLSGISLAIPATLLAVGVAGWLVSSLAIFVTGRIMPGVLYVRSFSTAMGASVILMLAGFAISQLLF